MRFGDELRYCQGGLKGQLLLEFLRNCSSSGNKRIMWSSKRNDKSERVVEVKGESELVIANLHFRKKEMEKEV